MVSGQRLAKVSQAWSSRIPVALISPPTRDPDRFEPVFVLAPARSYTSVISAMVGQHPDLVGLPELKLFSYPTIRELEDVAAVLDRARRHPSKPWPGPSAGAVHVRRANSGVVGLGARLASSTGPLVRRRRPRRADGADAAIALRGKIAGRCRERRLAPTFVRRLSPRAVPAFDPTSHNDPAVHGETHGQDLAGPGSQRSSRGRHRRVVRHSSTHHAICSGAPEFALSPRPIGRRLE